jgi:hypothetical protein
METKSLHREKTMKTNKYSYFYKCWKCGEEEEFIIMLPVHLLEHGSRARPCGGGLVFERKEEERE